MVADEDMNSISELSNNEFMIEGEEMSEGELIKRIKTNKFGPKAKLGNKMAIEEVGHQNNVRIYYKRNQGRSTKNIPLEEGEHWGVKLPDIRVPEAGKLIFPDENCGRRIVFSSNECVMSNSNWIEFHQQIKGEYKDVDFDFSITDSRKRKKKHLKPILGLEKELTPGLRLVY